MLHTLDNLKTGGGAGVTAPSLRVADAERLQMAAWNTTKTHFQRDAPVPLLVAAQAAATPHAAAVRASDRTLTYADLNARANRLAHRIRRMGVQRNACVGLCVERSADFVVAALAIFKAGAAYVALDPSHPLERLGTVLTNANVAVLICRSQLARRLLPGPWQSVVLDDEAGYIGDEPSVDPDVEITGDVLAYVIYTSGSTGRPKGVEVGHDSLLNLIYWHKQTFAVTPADRASQLASPAFDAAIWEIWPYLTAGASIHLPDEEVRANPWRLRDWLVDEGITISFAPTPLAEGLLALDWPATTRLRLLLTGADTLHHYPREGLPFSLINNYGPTECTVVTTSSRVTPSAVAGHLPPIGRPISNVQVHILDEQMKPVPIGDTGELYVGGAGLARGYLNRPDLTAQKFVPDPFSDRAGARVYRTGDLARYRPDGNIEFRGRLDQQVKIRGHRIEPEEIVALLDTHDGVFSSTVLAREDHAGDQRLIAYVVPMPKGQPSANELREFLAAQLPTYMLPAEYVRVDALPLTSNGKVDRSALPVPDATNLLGDGASLAALSLVEERLTAIVTGLLGLSRVGPEDNFFMLGGHSLLGTQVIARVRDAFSVELPLRSLFEAPTIRALAMEVERLIVAALERLTEDEATAILRSSPSLVGTIPASTTSYGSYRAARQA